MKQLTSWWTPPSFRVVDQRFHSGTSMPTRVGASIPLIHFNLDRISKPGTIPRTSWKAGKETGWANTISYNFNRGMDYAGVNEYQELSDAERQRLNKLVGQMLRIQENIRITVEDGLDDEDILDADLTGPIDWPSNWMDELPAEVVAAAQGSVSTPRLNVPAGHPCPDAGWWFSPAQANSRRYFKEGELMPALVDDFGNTYWQWSPDQTAPRL